MRVYDCPQCGAPVRFQSSIAVFAVCESCRSMVVVRGASVETLGEMAQLPPDLSPLQRGTRGVWNGAAFELVGRLRLEWEGGSWNEWYALLADGRTGWLAETQGFFTVSFQTDPGEPLPATNDLRPGARLVITRQERDVVRITRQEFEVVDVKSVVTLAAEGELPFVAPAGSTRTSADLMANDGAFATIESFPDELPELYTGAYAVFGALNFSNLRPVPGWDGEVTQTRHATTALNCPSCGAVINLHAGGQTMAAVCGSCGGLIDTANPQLRLIQEADVKIRELRPLIEIGRRGELMGAQYEVIGMLHRADAYSTWSEYLLFNPWLGFRWLVTYQGHWSLIDRLLEAPLRSHRHARLRDGRSFRHFASAATRVKAVVGEFFWKVRRGEESHLDDFVDPPWILSAERYPGLNEVTWSLGQYVEPEVVASAFGLPKPTEREGVYLNQPNPHHVRWKSVRLPALAFLALALLLQMFFAANSPKRVVIADEFFYVRGVKPAGGARVEADPAQDASRTVVTREFELTGRTQPVGIQLHAPVANNWLAVDYRLVNAQTNTSSAGTVGVEHYSGTSDGESWSEGSQYREVRIPAVPPGRYYLTLEPDADPQIEQMKYDVAVRRGGLFLSNFFIVFALLLAYPVWVFLRRAAFEGSRWAQSDYSSSD